LLERDLRRACFQRLGDTTFRGYAPDAGTYDLALLLDCEISSVQAAFDTPPNDGEVSMDASQVTAVVLDVASIESRRGELPVAATYAAWPVDRMPTSMSSGEVADSARVRGPILELAGPGSRARSGAPTLCVQSSAQAIAFGFIEPMRGGNPAVVHLTATVPLARLSPTESITVPFPSAALARTGALRLTLARDGRPFAVPGVGISVTRTRGDWPGRSADLDLRGEFEATTRADGTACMHLFPGRYSVAIDSPVSEYVRLADRPTVEVRAGERTEVKLSVELPR